MKNPGKFNILLVDDDIFVIRAIMNILIKNPDYIILTTGNGKSACEIAIEKLPDLIIMDWQMPVLNGIDATILLKQNEITKDIPVIISTGIMVESSNLSKALSSGAVDFIRKPIDEIELISRVTNALKLSNAYLKIEQQNILLQNELTSKLVNIQQLNELKNEVIKQIILIKEQLPVKNGQLNETMLYTERLLYSKSYQIKWTDFESHFDTVYQGFFRKLKMIDKSFTANELRLCSFIKLNMSNKEIATIIYTLPESVNTSRKRLKKKLGLQPDESLQLFIGNL